MTFPNGQFGGNRRPPVAPEPPEGDQFPVAGEPPPDREAAVPLATTDLRTNPTALEPAPPGDVDEKPSDIDEKPSDGADKAAENVTAAAKPKRGRGRGAGKAKMAKPEATKILVVKRDGQTIAHSDAVVIVDLDDASEDDTDPAGLINLLRSLREVPDDSFRREVVDAVKDLIEAKALQ